MPCYVFVPDDLERAKILATEAYGAKVVAVKGNYDDVNRLCSEVAEALPWAFVNVNMRPYYAEGSKSLGFETAEQLGWRLPDHVRRADRLGRPDDEDPPRVPRADRDRRRRGDAVPHLRRAGGGVLARRAGVRGTRRRGRAAGEAEHDRALARDREPADGFYAIQTAKETGGAIEACTEQEIVDGIRLLAETEGVFTETAGGVTIAKLDAWSSRRDPPGRGDGRATSRATATRRWRRSRATSSLRTTSRPTSTSSWRR